IPKAPISESYDSSALICKHLFSASLQLFADSSGRNLTDLIQVKVLGDRIIIRDSVLETSRIYEAPVFKSNDEDMEH
ncbi:13721_t:CDS:2, partial [Funneliformis geosporum]